jgi:dihydrofolate reductase
MAKLKVQAFAVSIDGYGAGPRQSLDAPLGVGGEALHQWFFHTRTFHEMMGGEGGDTDVDDEFARRAMDNIGAWILGRNMFGPVRGPWPDDQWKGWWGENPRTTSRPSCSRTTPALPSRWKAAPFFISSPVASTRR